MDLMSPLNIPSTTHAAPLHPPSISSSLHSPSSAPSSIPKYQTSKRLLLGWPSQGSPWAGWANGSPCLTTGVCTYTSACGCIRVLPLSEHAWLLGGAHAHTHLFWHSHENQPSVTQRHLHVADYFINAISSLYSSSLAPTQFWGTTEGRSVWDQNYCCLPRSDFCT